MKKLFGVFLILLSLFAPLGDASAQSEGSDAFEKNIPWNEVISAFMWIKVQPDFPVIMNSESESQASFRIFNDVYTLTRLRSSFKIDRLTYLRDLPGTQEESVELPVLTVEKILRFVKARARARGVLPPDIFLNSIQTQTAPEGFQPSSSLYQCRSDLPARIKVDGNVILEILQHTWIQNGAAESFGMPNTDNATYFGGSSHIRTPDSFIVRGPKHLECSPMWVPADKDQAKLSEKIRCVAKHLSLPQEPIFDEPVKQGWVAQFDYHALERNCLLAVRFMAECAGGFASQVVNAGIGGKVNWDYPYSVSSVSSAMRISIAEVNAYLQKLRDLQGISTLPPMAEEILDRAIELDAQLRGISGKSETKNLEEICDLALQSCAN